MKGLILSCRGVLVTDEWTDERMDIGCCRVAEKVVGVSGGSEMGVKDGGVSGVEGSGKVE